MKAWTEEWKIFLSNADEWHPSARLNRCDSAAGCSLSPIPAGVLSWSLIFSERLWP